MIIAATLRRRLQSSALAATVLAVSLTAGCAPLPDPDMGASSEATVEASPPAAPVTPSLDSAPTADAARGYPAPDAAATTTALPAALAAALAACDEDGLEKLIGYRFTVRHVPGGGTDLLGDYGAARWLAAQTCPPSGSPPALESLPAALAPVTETLRGAVDPSNAVAAVLFQRGLGADGRGEARWTALRQADGAVALGAVEWATAGFDALAEPEAGATRTVRLTTQVGQDIDIDVPVAWHSDGSSGKATVTSYLPYAYALDDEHESEGFAPGQTKIEIYGPDRGDDATLDERIAGMTWYDEPPTTTDVEHFTLASGEAAALAQFTFARSSSSVLYIVTEGGVMSAPCLGDQGSCPTLLRTVRLR